MMDCCSTGFLWNGEPTGIEQEIGALNVYIAGSGRDNAVLFCHDAFGWQFNNNRLLADHFANEIGVTVYLPDFFHGDAIPPDRLSPDPAAFDWPSWLGKNGVDVRLPEILSFAQRLRVQHDKLAVVGYCWGGKAALVLSGKDHFPLVDCISIAHPSFITKNEISKIAVSVQIIAPEEDPAYTEELKSYSNEVIPKIGVDYDYQYFPAVQHGFATRCNMESEMERKALERAKNAVVYWFSSQLSK